MTDNRVKMFSTFYEKDRADLQERMRHTAGLFKGFMAVANNSAYYAMMNALDAAKRLPMWKDYRVRRAFNNVLLEWKKYECELARSPFFDLKDHGAMFNCSNNGYYEFWQGVGAEAYDKTKAFVSSLANKYRLALMNHGHEYAEDLAAVLCGLSCVGVAVTIYEHALKDCCAAHKTPLWMFKKNAEPMSLRLVERKMIEAVKMVEPSDCLTAGEARNIQLGVDQLFEIWYDFENLKKYTGVAIDSYEEVFADLEAAHNTIR